MIVLRDLDDLLPDQVDAWIAAEIESLSAARDWAVDEPETDAAGPRIGYRDVNTPNGRSRVVAVGAGRTEDEALAGRYQLERFALDDYLVGLLEDPAIYEGLTEVKDVIPHDLAMKKLESFTEHMGANGLPLKLSKRVLHLFRGIVGFRASPAEFADRMVALAKDRRGREWLRDHFAQLTDDLDLAARLVLPAQES